MEDFRNSFRLPVSEYYKSIGIEENKIEKVESKWHEFYQIHKNLVKPFPEVKDVLRNLKGKVKLGVSSATPDYLLEEHLRRFEISDYFDAVTGSKNFREEKSEIISATLSKLKVGAENSAYVGDMEEDIVAGKKIGVYTIAVDREGAYHPMEKLKRHNPDYIITNLNDLLNIVCIRNLG
jgi:HAD superfamily hydrolase (TIGR01549 family)